MNAKQLAKKVNKNYRDDNGGMNMTENGHRIRVTKECIAKGDDVVELGDTFFYRSQGHPAAVLDVIAAYAGEPVKLVPVSEVSYGYRAWPQDSWATQLYRIEQQ